MNLMSCIVLSSDLRSGLRKFIFALLVAATGANLRAADSGNDVVVVYNTRVPESKGVAEYYAQRRSVPKDHIFGFSMTTNEEISRVEFHDALQNPLAKALEDNHLWHIGSTIVPATTNKARHVEW